MKRYIRSNSYFSNFPEQIEIEMYPGHWYTYTKQYEHEGGGCYYYCREETGSPSTSSFISLYPDGTLTSLWNSREYKWDRNWR